MQSLRYCRSGGKLLHCGAGRRSVEGLQLERQNIIVIIIITEAKKAKTVGRAHRFAGILWRSTGTVNPQLHILTSLITCMTPCLMFAPFNFGTNRNSTAQRTICIISQLHGADSSLTRL